MSADPTSEPTNLLGCTQRQLPDHPTILDNTIPSVKGWLSYILERTLVSVRSPIRLRNLMFLCKGLYFVEAPCRNSIYFNLGVTPRG